MPENSCYGYFATIQKKNTEALSMDNYFACYAWCKNAKCGEQVI